MNASRIETIRARISAKAYLTENDREDILVLLQEKLAILDFRPEVLAFARLMEDRLQANENKGGWRGCHVVWLFNRLMGEARELEHELDTEQYLWVDKEAADVANFAMMIVDVCGRLKIETKTGATVGDNPAGADSKGGSTPPPGYESYGVDEFGHQHFGPKRT